MQEIKRICRERVNTRSRQTKTMSDILKGTVLDYDKDFIEVYRDGNDHAYIALHDICLTNVIINGQPESEYLIDVNDVVIESAEIEILGDDYYNHLYEGSKMMLLNICLYLNDANFDDVLVKLQVHNDLDWYVVVYDDTNLSYNRVELKHATGLSNILQCGYPASDYGIEAMHQCGLDDEEEEEEN